MRIHVLVLEAQVILKNPCTQKNESKKVKTVNISKRYYWQIANQKQKATGQPKFTKKICEEDKPFIPKYFNCFIGKHGVKVGWSQPQPLR